MSRQGILPTCLSFMREIILSLTSHWPEYVDQHRQRCMELYDCLNQSPSIPPGPGYIAAGANLWSSWHRIRGRCSLVESPYCLYTCTSVPPDPLRSQDGSPHVLPPSLLNSYVSFKVQPGATSSRKLSLVAHPLLCPLSASVHWRYHFPSLLTLRVSSEHGSPLPTISVSRAGTLGTLDRSSLVGNSSTEASGCSRPSGNGVSPTGLEQKGQAGQLW